MEEAKSTVHKPQILKIKVNRNGMEPGVISKEAVGNSLDILNAILGRRYYRNPPESHRKRIKPKFATESEFYRFRVVNPGLSAHQRRRLMTTTSPTG